MLARLFNSLLYRLQKRLRPEMIGGFRNAAGKKGIRISNHSHISFPERLKLGNHVFIGHFNYIDCFKGITIEDGVQITNYCSLLNHSSHHAIRLYGPFYNDYAPNLKGLTEGPIEIGAYSYIGAHSVIMPGVTLGKGVIVGAFSYVKPGVYPDFAVLRGIPAQVVGDSRTLDQELLKAHPDLKSMYYLNCLECD